MVGSMMVQATTLVLLASVLSTSAKLLVPRQVVAAREEQQSRRLQKFNLTVPKFAAGSSKHSNTTHRDRRHADDPCPIKDGAGVSYVSKIQTSAHNFSGGGAISIQWIGQSTTDEMMVTTDSSPANTNLYFSSDYGSNFVQPLPNVKFSEVTYSSVPEGESYWAFGLPENEEGIYVSKNNGEKFTSFALDGSTEDITTVIPNPKSASQFLAISSKFAALSCVVTNRVTCTKITKVVGETEEKAIRLEWSETGLGSSSIVFMMTTLELSVGDENHTFHRIDLDDSSNNMLMAMTDHLEQRSQYVFVTSTPDPNSLFESVLYVSTDDARSFTKAEFPFIGRNNHHAVVDASEDFVLVAVDHNRTRVEGDVTVEVNGQQLEAKRALFSEVLAAPTVGLLYYNASNSKGCLDDNDATIAGRILVLHRGECKFVEKAAFAQTQNAKGLIVVNSDDIFLPYMQASSGSEYPNIPVVMINMTAGQTLITKITDGVATGDDVSVEIAENNTMEKVLYQTTNLYMSDTSGIHFSISLKDVSFKVAANSMEESYVDVYKVESMTGVYIANYNIMSWPRSTKTVITYNNGVNWWSVKPPEDRRCSEETMGCSLSIVLESKATDGTPLPLSTNFAVGLVIANAYENSDEPYTMISRDFGFTWHQLVDETDAKSTKMGVHDYRVLDHGSVIVFTEWRQTTDRVLISFDEAQNGEVVEYNFMPTYSVEKDVFIAGIVTEPGATSTTAFIYYWTSETTMWHGVVLKFRSVFGGECGIDDMEDVETPVGASIGGCVLGAKVKSQRRKPCNVCWNKGATARAKSIEPCQRCTSGDYRCAPGFHRVEFVDADPESTECVSDVDAQQPNCDSSGEKKMAKYELIVNDKCRNPNSTKFVEKVGVPCHAPSSSVLEEIGTGIGYLVGLAVLSVLILAFVFTFSKTARDKAVQIFGTEGTVGKFLTRFACFRATPTHVYSILADEAQNLTEDAAQMYDGVEGDDDDDDDEDDEDDLLFDLDDTQMEGAKASDENRGLPVYN
eukprot:m.224551 g.224551  ORF g.224551 m.224551 type:complete len:1019 (-) comp33435_c2_seq1:293-3349(-)